LDCITAAERAVYNIQRFFYHVVEWAYGCW